MTTGTTSGERAVEAPEGARKASAPVALVLVGALFLVALLTLVQVVSLFGLTTEAAALFPFHLAFFVFPAWVLLRLLPRGVVPDRLWPHPMRALAVGILLLLVVVPLTLEAVRVDLPSTEGDKEATFLVAGPLAMIGVAGFLVATTRSRHVTDADPVLSESVLLRAWLRFSFGLFGGLGVVVLVFLSFALLGNPLDRLQPVRLDLAAWFAIATILAVASTFAVAWLFGYVYSGVLRVGHARARSRRVTDAKALKGRLDDHYSLRRVEEPTFRGLRDRLDQEIDGHVPGEERFLRSREGIVRVSILALLLLVAGGGVGYVIADIGWTIEGQEAYREDVDERDPYGSCSWCGSESDWDRYLAYPKTAQALFPAVLVATFLLAAHAAVLVPLLVGEMRHARTEMKDFWDERRVLEERMLEEVRASSA